MVLLFCHVRSKEDEALDPLVFTWSLRGESSLPLFVLEFSRPLLTLCPSSSTAIPVVDSPSRNVARSAGLLPLPRVHQNDLLLVGVLLFVQAVSAGAAIRHAIPFPGAEGTVDGVA